MRRRFLHVIVVLALSGFVHGFLASSGAPAAPESIRSWPPYTKPFARPAVPQDLTSIKR